MRKEILLSPGSVESPMHDQPKEELRETYISQIDKN